MTWIAQSEIDIGSDLCGSSSGRTQEFMVRSWLNIGGSKLWIESWK